MSDKNLSVAKMGYEKLQEAVRSGILNRREEKDKL